jgi:hypothetical protein
MKTIELRILVTSLLYLFIIASGIWLSHSGRPLNVAIFTIHKLISLLAVILISVAIYHIQKNVQIRNSEIIILVATGICFLLAFISGALLSFEKPVNDIVLTIHKITPLLIVIFTVMTIYRLKQ